MVLSDRLRKSKVAKDRKWVYTLIAWALDNQEKDINTFQRRIQASVHYAKGKYTDYWNNPINKEKHKEAVKKCLEKNKEQYMEQSKNYNREKSLAYKLYKEGKLSKQSIKLIEKEIKNQEEK